ncbi:MAG: TetR/AcrR family transcriptional regulator [Sphingomonadales bacterium]|nr:TetR/AcrR family transcriptional regulator [Sphingomonadales bacterium]
MPAREAGRSNQRRRTRKAILDAAARLAGQGQTPTLEDVAQEALVSRATAYRYFPSIEALLVEASLHIAFPDAQTLFGDESTDPAERIVRAERAVHAMVLAHEPALRLMLASSVTQPHSADGEPVRQNRRTPLIELALAPARARLGEAAFERLAQALALIIGTESLIVCKDVLGIDEAQAGALKLWTAQALVKAALAEAQ